MSFISPEFVVFFCLFFPAYFILPARFRVALLLVSSYAFYAYGHAEYLWIIVLTTVIDYMAGRMIDRAHNPATRRAWLLASLSANLGVLFVFKYFNFLNHSLAALFTASGAAYPVGDLSLALPVGISFYTFQSMAYTIDVYRRRIPPEHSLLTFATFIAYWPQLVAGPIERAAQMLPQFHLNIDAGTDEARIVSGLQRMLWGFFKKVVIADRLAIYVNAVYNDLGSYSGLPLVIATLFFAFQIYCDFSAYSDIAIGAARVMGFTLMENFRQPYFARSVRDFWGRWHISLSTWFRDYLYIPLGGNRVRLPRYLFNLFIIFLVSGLWHGANWTFVIWGALHGVYVVIEALLERRRAPLLDPPLRHGLARLAPGVPIAVTFLLITVSWVFFRANSLADALYVLGHVFSPMAGGLLEPFAAALLPNSVEFMLACGLIGLLLAVDAAQARGFRFALQPRAVRWLAYYSLTAAIIASGWYGTGAAEFIYFQF